MDDFEGPFDEEMYFDEGKTREDWVRELADEEWNLNTMLEAHDGLLDRRPEVRSAAFGALMALAEKDPDPVEVTPLSLLRSYAGAFTVASGAAPAFYRFLVELDIEDANLILRDILQKTDGMRNRDFENLVRFLFEADAQEHLQQLERADLSNKKGKIFRRLKSEHAET